MKCESRFSKPFIAPRRAQNLAAALLVFAIFIGALGAAVPAMQAQQAVIAAPAGSPKAAPPPKAETPPLAESTTDILSQTSGLTSLKSVCALPHNGFFKTNLANRGSTDFTPERKL